MLRHQIFIFAALSLGLLSACGQNGDTHQASADDGQLVTSAMFTVDGNVFETQITANSGQIDALDLDLLTENISIHHVNDLGDDFEATNPEWLSVEIFSMTAGVNAEDYLWNLNIDLSDEALVSPDVTTDVITSDTRGAGSSWSTPDLGGVTPFSPETLTTSTSKVNPHQNTIDEGNPFGAFDFDQDDYLIETYRPPKKRHRKRH